MGTAVGRARTKFIAGCIDFQLNKLMYAHFKPKRTTFNISTVTTGKDKGETGFT